MATIGSITAPNELCGLAAGVSIHHAYEHPSDPFSLLGPYTRVSGVTVAPASAACRAAQGVKVCRLGTHPGAARSALVTIVGLSGTDTKAAPLFSRRGSWHDN